MDRKPDLELRRLGPEEERLAANLASVIQPDDPGESWGVGPTGVRPGAKQIWGVFMHDALISALWLTAAPGGTVRLVAMAVPRKRGRMGLLAFMMDILAPQLANSGGKEILVTVERGGPILAESLVDAGFAGPDSDDDDYPAGEWRREL